MKKLLLFFVAVSTLVGCSKSDGPNPEFKINQKEVKLNFDGSFDFKVENASNVSWSSSDEFVGTVASDGKFKAKHIGEATITGVADGKSVSAKVIVEPYVTDIIEPLITFGASKANVKSFEKRALQNETSTGLLYNGQGNKEKQVVYVFENSLLKSPALTFNANFNDIGSVLAKFYSERYTVIGAEDGVIYFESKDKKSAVAIGASASLGLSAIYLKGASALKTFMKANSYDAKSKIIEDIKINIAK